MPTFSTTPLSPLFTKSKTPGKQDLFPLQKPKQFPLRREFLTGLTISPLILLNIPASEAREVVVGSYLPPSPADPSFVLFKATPKDTPALRAGTKTKKFPKFLCIRNVSISVFILLNFCVFNMALLKQTYLFLYYTISGISDFISRGRICQNRNRVVEERI